MDTDSVFPRLLRTRLLCKRLSYFGPSQNRTGTIVHGGRKWPPVAKLSNGKRVFARSRGRGGHKARMGFTIHVTSMNCN
jgi:hypothetical protein